MAAPLRFFMRSARFSRFCSEYTHSKVLDVGNIVAINQTSKRYLFSDDILGIEGYKKHRSFTMERMGSLKEGFRDKMEQYLKSEDKGTVFSDDLKTMLSCAETDEDIETVLKMLQKYLEQQDLRFNTYQFGPILMRLLHLQKQPDKALEIFNDEKYSTLFEQMSSCLTLMDNLFINGKYDETELVFDKVFSQYLERKERTDDQRFPRDCGTLLVASCFKKGTKEAYENMLNRMKLCRDNDVNLPDRAIIIAAFNAIKHDDAKTALDLASLSAKDSLPGTMNLKAIAFAKLNRPEDSLSIITTVLYRDMPSHYIVRQDIYPETIQAIGEAVELQNRSELTNKFQIILKDLTRTGHINALKFEQYIFQPVVRPKLMKAGFKSRERSPAGDFYKSGNMLRRKNQLFEE